MVSQQLAPPVPTTDVVVHQAKALPTQLERLEGFLLRKYEALHLSRHPAWLSILADGLQQVPYCLEAVEEGSTRGFLPLCYVQSVLFGRFLVSLPYLNYGGVVTDDDAVAQLLIDRAVRLADELKVRHLELRHEQAIEHPALAHTRGDKVHMRLNLPSTPEALWSQLSAKVRNQVRKGQKSELSVAWGTAELLPEFYDVFSRNMRDLGTPVYSQRLFRSILRHYPDRAELCVVRLADQPVASGLLLHGWKITEVPSASSLREYNPTCANMLLYWQLLERTIQRGQQVFDFGRSTQDSNTFRFKKQWGATPFPAAWQSYLRSGNPGQVRQDNPRYQRFIRIWQRLPVSLTRLIGPAIVRGIP